MSDNQGLAGKLRQFMTGRLSEDPYSSPESQVTRSDIFPMRMEQKPGDDMGELFFDPGAGIIGELVRAAGTPKRVLEGEYGYDIGARNPELLKDAGLMALEFTGAGLAIPKPKGALGMSGGDLGDAVQAAREARKVAAQERGRIKPEAERDVLDEEYIDTADGERLIDQSRISTVSKVRQELESIGLDDNAFSNKGGPWPKQRVISALSKRGVSKDQMEASGILALLDRKPNVTKAELVAQHERFAPQLSVEARMGDQTQWSGTQRIYELAEGTSAYAPEKYTNYSELVIRNQNPEISADYVTADNHNMGGVKGGRGEVASARTSEYTESGVGRVEMIEEVQSDLFKVYQSNLDAQNPAKTMKSLKTAGRNAKLYSDAVVPKAEEAAKILEDALASDRFDLGPEFRTTVQETANSLRKSSKEYQNKVALLNHRIKTHPNKPELVAETMREMRMLEADLSLAWKNSNNNMFDLSTAVYDKTDPTTTPIAAALNKFRISENIELDGRLHLLKKDASVAQERAVDAVDMQVRPQMSPRVVERSQDPKFQELYQKFEDVDRVARQAGQGADRALNEIEALREKVKEEHLQLDLYEEREIFGVDHPSIKDSGPVMQQKILRGDKKNKESSKNRIKNFEKRIDDLESIQNRDDSLATSSRLKRDEYLRRMGTTEEDRMALHYLQVQSGRMGAKQINPINPAMPFGSLNDVTQFVYETLFERALNNPSLKGVVLPDYRDIAAVPSRGTEDLPEAFKIGYEDAPKAVIKRLKKRYPDIEVTRTNVPGAEFPATLIKFPKKRTAEEPLIQGYAQGGMVYKGIGSMGREVL